MSYKLGGVVWNDDGTMKLELENLSSEEKWNNFLEFVDAPTKARLLECDYKEGLEQYRYLRTEIETELKDGEKNKKALEIIKKYPFVVQFIQTKQSYSDLAITMPNTEIPTKEDYELLKEILK